LTLNQGFNESKNKLKKLTLNHWFFIPIFLWKLSIIEFFSKAYIIASPWFWNQKMEVINKIKEPHNIY
jgi:hypothetical protein